MGDTVTLLEISSDETEDYTIVGTTEANVLTSPPKISNEAPIGKTLMGKKKGVTIKVKSNA